MIGFRSYVCESLRYGNLFLAGDAGHTVPPTGAKGLTWLRRRPGAVRRLGIVRVHRLEGRSSISTATALQRIWKAQDFSYWMTTMLHQRPDTRPLEGKRQLGELSAVVNSRHGSAYLAEPCTRWPST